MNVEYFKDKLLAKRRELVEAIAKAEQEGRIEGEEEVRDEGDLAVDDEDAATVLQIATVNSETLEQVEDALVRIEKGTYGKCVICGKPIEPARLEALPWTPYCLADQQKLEKVKGPGTTPTL